MENNLINEAIHIEFYGLPGCGKSTISHKVAEQLRCEGFNVIEPSYDILYGNKKIDRLLKKKIYSIKLYIKDRNIYNRLKKLVKINKYKGLEVYKQVANIAYKVYIYNYSPKNIYIWDEGIVQSAISLSMYNNINSNDNLIELKNITNNSINCKVYLNINLEEIKKRLSKREIKHSRIEKFEKDKLDEMLLVLKKKSEDILIDNIDFSITSEYSNITKIKERLIDILNKEGK